jgi:hypothetical protein
MTFGKILARFRRIAGVDYINGPIVKVKGDDASLELITLTGKGVAGVITFSQR